MVNNIDIGRIDMGERKCAFDGCNALEFRATGYCLRHGEKGLNTKKIRVVEVPKDGEREEIKAEWILFLIGIPISFFGYRLLQVEPVIHWYGELINLVVKICGIVSLVVGTIFLLMPIIEKYEYKIRKSSKSELSFEPSTGMYYFPTNQERPEEQKASEE
ncbi:MAG: hypothetical protein CMB47_04145 [Euryarchaeota archaeon]|nr:hypothetical protein [Euryarchaeota archaeon]